MRGSTDGSLGVRIFFVISGFIITLLLLQEEQDRGAISLGRFYRRRAARILPAYWTYLGVVALFGWQGVFPLHFTGDVLRPLTFTIGLNLWSKPIAWQTAHTWSLSIEEQFYLLWPMMLVQFRNRGRLWAAIAVVATGPIARWWIYQHPQHWGLGWTIIGNADLLAWGCLLAIVDLDHPDLLAKIVGWRPAIARSIAITVVQFAPWYFRNAFVRKYPPLSANALAYSAQALAIAFLIASLTHVRRGMLYRMLNWRWVAAIGIISYSLYLWQQLFLASSGEAPIWNRWPMNICCVFATAIASYLFIEQPLRSAFRSGRPAR